MRDGRRWLTVLALVGCVGLSGTAHARDWVAIRLLGAFATSHVEDGRLGPFAPPTGSSRGCAVYDLNTSLQLPTPTTDCTVVKSDGGTGFGLSVEFRPIHRLGVEVGGMDSAIDASIGTAYLGVNNPGILSDNIGFSDASEFEIDYTPLWVGVNAHVFRPENKIDFYIGLSYVRVDFKGGDLIYLRPPQNTLANPVQMLPATFEMSDDDEALGFNIGFDYKLGKHFLIGSNFRYFASAGDMSITIDSTQEVIPAFQLKMDLYTVGVTIGARF